MMISTFLRYLLVWLPIMTNLSFIDLGCYAHPPRKPPSGTVAGRPNLPQAPALRRHHLIHFISMADAAPSISLTIR